ncbi:MAG: hypothetical protein LBG66_04935 [Gallionellaceae bacterium]|nr:hypothetical protein [Gallionellaceae bacterium]
MKKFLLFALAIGMFNQAEAHICWIDRVEKHDKELQVFIAHNGPTRNFLGGATQNKDGSFTLKEGESILLANNPEDSCTIKAAVEDGVLGLRLNASECLMVGFGGDCHHVTEFAPAE